MVERARSQRAAAARRCDERWSDRVSIWTQETVVKAPHCCMSAFACYMAARLAALRLFLRGLGVGNGTEGLVLTAGHSAQALG